MQMMDFIEVPFRESKGWPRSRREAFTMIEVCAVLFLITIMIWLLLPAVQAAREMARRTSCSNNLTQVALGVRAYQSSFGQFPVQMHGTDGSIKPGEDNNQRLSFLVGILPYVGQPELYEMIDKPLDRSWRNTNGYDMAYYGNDDFDDVYLSEQELAEYESELELAMTAESPDAFGDSGDAEDTVRKEGMWPRGGPEPFTRGYLPWNVLPPVYRCPSDPGMGAPAMGRTNYVACLGDALLAGDTGPYKEVNGLFVIDKESAKQTAAAMRGAFVPRAATSDEDIKDGISHTILLGEIATDLGDQDTRTTPIPGPEGEQLRDNPDWVRQQPQEAFTAAFYINPERPRFWGGVATSSNLATNPGQRRGHRWADGAPLYTAFNTILPPNREIVLYRDRDDSWGVLGASSRHQGGAHVALVDGSVRFVGDSIDSGDTTLPSVYDGSESKPGSESPYGVWGALGTRDANELSANSFEKWQ